MYLFEVKKPAESKGPWDYYKLIAPIPGDEAFRPLEQGRLPAGEEGVDDGVSVTPRPDPPPQGERGLSLASSSPLDGEGREGGESAHSKGVA